MFRCLGSITAVMLGITLLFGSPPAAKADIVTLELSLLADVSGSILPAEYTLQMQGYQNAFLNPGVQAAILALPNGMAVNFVQWSGNGQQSQTIAWTKLDSVASINAFAALVGGQARAFSGNTAPGSAINFGYPLIFSNTYDSDRQIIDVSGDGVANEGANTLAARDAALAAGVDAINGLVIGSNGADALFNFYNNNIRGGATGFVEVANNFGDFQDAVTRKLQYEIAGVPAPAGVILAGLGAGCLLIALRFTVRSKNLVAA